MTAETLGKQLAHARALKGVSLEEAAHVTKIRPDKLAALEHDDLSAFPNNTYARGFLQIYGRYLGVDVSDLASQLDSGNPISVQDYQYLSAEPDAEPEQRLRMRPREAQSRRPSVAPLIVFVLLLTVAAFVVNFVIKAQQLGSTDPSHQPLAEASVEKPGAPPDPAGTQPEAPAGAAPRATLVPALSDRDFLDKPASQLTQPPPTANTPAGATLPAAVPAAPAPTPATSGATAPTPQLPAPTPRIAQLTVAQLPTLNELSIEPTKKSRVRIRRNDFAAAPIFEDYLYPDVGPLKIKGSKFYVEVLGDGAVNIRKNGLPFAYQAPGVVIQ